MNTNKENLQNKAKETVEKGKEKINEFRQSSVWQKTKKAVKEGAEIAGAHLAIAKTSIVLSNEEARLMKNLKEKLNNEGIYPSESEILRAGLWSLRNKNKAELEEAVKDLFKVKQTRVL